MQSTPIETVTFSEAEPSGGYTASSQVKVSYKDGTDLADKNPDGAFTAWGADGPEGGVKLWRQLNGDAAALAYVEPPVPVPTSADVNTERDRRITAGRSFTVTGSLDVAITGADRDMIILQAKASEAAQKKAAGSVAADIVLRDANNNNLLLTPDQMLDLVSQGTIWVQAVMQTSWDMKDGVGDFTGGIPDDYSDDRHWP